MKHYICKGGCKGVSSEQVSCGAKDCPKHGKPLEVCDCKDDSHNGAFEESTNGTNPLNSGHK